MNLSKKVEIVIIQEDLLQQDIKQVEIAIIREDLLQQEIKRVEIAVIQIRGHILYIRKNA
ncbi:20246_t:CDS:2, partial [Cetraspora pellucida]